MRLRFAVLAVLAGELALSACGRKAGRAAAPATGPSHALNAAGEPQWSAQVRDGMLTIAPGDTTPFTLKAALADHGAAGLVWSGSIPPGPGHAGGMVRLSAAPKPCRDADTGMTYPLTAALDTPGGRFGGCAALPGQGLGPRS